MAVFQLLCSVSLMLLDATGLKENIIFSRKKKKKIIQNFLKISPYQDMHQCLKGIF